MSRAILKLVLCQIVKRNRAKTKSTYIQQVLFLPSIGDIYQSADRSRSRFARLADVVELRFLKLGHPKCY